MIAFGHLLHLRSGIGDRDEMAAGFSAPTVCFVRSKKYCLKMFGSSVLPDLLETMNSVFAMSIWCSNAFTCAGSVESSTCRVGKLRNPAEGHAQNFRTQAGSAHAQQQYMLEAARVNLFRELLQLILLRDLLFDNVEPSQPVGFVASGPQARIALPQTLHFPAATASRRSSLSPLCQRFRQGSLQSAHVLSFWLRIFLHRRQQFVEGVGEQLHAIVSQLVGDFLDRNSRSSPGRPSSFWRPRHLR